MSELNGRRPARAGGAIAGGLIVLTLLVVAANMPHDLPSEATPAKTSAPPPAKVQSANSFPADKIQYDPENARKLAISQQVNADTDYCVDQYVRNLLRNGDRSREHIATLVSEKCSQEIVHNGLMPADDAVAGVKVQAYTAMDDIISEGQ